MKLYSIFFSELCCQTGMKRCFTLQFFCPDKWKVQEIKRKVIVMIQITDAGCQFTGFLQTTSIKWTLVASEMTQTRQMFWEMYTDFYFYPSICEKSENHQSHQVILRGGTRVYPISCPILHSRNYILVWNVVVDWSIHSQSHTDSMACFSSFFFSCDSSVCHTQKQNTLL